MEFFMFLQAAYLFFNKHVTLDFGGFLGESLSRIWRSIGRVLFPF